MLYML